MISRNLRLEKPHTSWISTHRSCRGQMFGVVDLMILVPATVAAVLLLLNVGVSTYYKEKLGFIGNQAAQYCYTVATTTPEANWAKETSDFVAQLLPAFGMKASNLNVRSAIANVMIAGSLKKQAQVTITNSFNLLGPHVNFLPTQVTLSDSAAATSPVTVLAATGPQGPMGPQGPPGATGAAGGGSPYPVVGYAKFAGTNVSADTSTRVSPNAYIPRACPKAS